METTQLFYSVPISNPPRQDGVYMFIRKNGTGQSLMWTVQLDEGDVQPEALEFTHYLMPLFGVDMPAEGLMEYMQSVQNELPKSSETIFKMNISDYLISDEEYFEIAKPIVESLIPDFILGQVSEEEKAVLDACREKQISKLQPVISTMEERIVSLEQELKLAKAINAGDEITIKTLEDKLKEVVNEK